MTSTLARQCGHCENVVPYQGKGQPRRFCDEGCKRAWRRSQRPKVERAPRPAREPHPPAESQVCKLCGIDKPAADYLPDPRYVAGLRSWCKSCYADYQLGRRDINIKSERKSKYGISVEDQDAMWERQCGRCASCGHPFARLGEAHLDHCHTTGRVRAFLCGPCNHIVGRCGEDVDHLVAVAEYLIAQREVAA